MNDQARYILHQGSREITILLDTWTGQAWEYLIMPTGRTSYWQQIARTKAQAEQMDSQQQPPDAKGAGE